MTTADPSRSRSALLVHGDDVGAQAAAVAGRGLALLGHAVELRAGAPAAADLDGWDALVACGRAAVALLDAAGVPPGRRVTIDDPDELVRATGGPGSAVRAVAALSRQLDALDAPPAVRPPGGEERWTGPTVVIAVYGALDDLDRCVASVLAHTGADVRVLLVNDGTPDPDAGPRLAALAAGDERCRLVTRHENRGYTATINEGIAAVGGDVVLLNSDTEVAPGWLDRLTAVAYSRSDVATVTPVSNAAGAFSVPQVNANEDLPEDVDTATMDRLVQAVTEKRRPAVPTGNGFCMYVRRTALDAVGDFDEFAFPRGYGEENDFCMRALAAGLVNLVDDATFVYHRRSASFGETKAELLRESRAVLDRLHPAYTRRVREWVRGDDLTALRAGVQTALANGADGVARVIAERPTVLFVLHAGGGGTPQTNADLMASLAGRYRPLLLRCALSEWALEDHTGTVLRTWSFATPWDARGGLEAERSAALREALEAYAVAVVHVRSLVAFAPEHLPEIAALGRRLIVSFHDFYAVCPTIQLLDAERHYCGGTCTDDPKPCPLALAWFGRPMRDLKHDYVHTWRARMAAGFEHADAFVTTTQAAADVIKEHFPPVADRLRLIDHGRDTGHYRHVGVAPTPGARQRVVSFGALGTMKGIDLIEQVMKLDEAAGPRFEFHFVGLLHGRWHPEEWGGVVHGTYERGALGDILAAIEPQYALIASIWPETYCHTLTEAWACGLPVFASDIGALEERVARHGGGWLLDFRDPEAWYAEMCRVADDPAHWRRQRQAVDRLPPRTVDGMSTEYAALYREVLAAGGGGR